MQSSPPVSPPNWRFGPFELDVRAYQLRRQGRAIRLERRPMDLLILLVERRGELVTRQEIIERLWGRDVFVDVDTGVSTVVWKVRAALRDSADSPRFIETVPAKGFDSQLPWKRCTPKVTMIRGWRAARLRDLRLPWRPPCPTPTRRYALFGGGRRRQWLPLH